MDSLIGVREDANWQYLLQFLPEGWRSQAKELQAYHRLRGVPSVELLLRILLLHLVDGVSLVQTANIAAQAGWAQLSDVSVLKRLRSAEQWFRWMSLELASQAHPARIRFDRPPWVAPFRVRSVEATVVSEPGSTGTNWRVHYSLGLFDLACDAFRLTDQSIGETVQNFTFHPQDLVVADRAYCSGKSIAWLRQQEASYVFRYKPRSLRLFQDAARRQTFEVLAHARTVPLDHPRSWQVTPPAEVPGPVRIILLKKSRAAAAQARQAYRYHQRRKQKPINPAIVELHGYVILVTNVIDPAVTDADLLNLYRLRWQIEIAFKRLKSIMGLGHLPKYEARSCRAWLAGKLFVALLLELLVEAARLFSPWGYPLTSRA